jgi:hypothetical protein
LINLYISNTWLTWDEVSTIAAAATAAHSCTAYCSSIVDKLPHHSFFLFTA